MSTKIIAPYLKIFQKHIYGVKQGDKVAASGKKRVKEGMKQVRQLKHDSLKLWKDAGQNTDVRMRCKS